LFNFPYVVSDIWRERASVISVNLKWYEGPKSA